MDCSQSRHYRIGLKIVRRIQKWLWIFGPYFEFISNITQPFISYYVLFPITFFVMPHLGLSVLWAAIIAESITVILKTLTNGDRPYWWAKEHTKCDIVQYSTTCANTAGTPSGHLAITGASLLVMALMSCAITDHTKRIHSIAYFIITSMLLSRMFIAASFPHQVLVGLLIAIIVATLVTNFDFYKSSPLVYLKAAIIMLFLSVFVMNVMPKFGFCSLEPFMKAHKFCADSKWLPKCYTRTSVSLLKLSGILAGTGISLLIISVMKGCKVELQPSIFKRLLGVILSLIVTFFIYVVSGKHFGPGLPGYSFVFLKNMLLPLSIIVIIPLLIDIYN